MTRLGRFGLAGLLAVAGCTLGWRDTPGVRVLGETLRPPAADGREESPGFSRRVSLEIPKGWHWYVRGTDLMATRDGPFLQHILVERVGVGQRDQAIGGVFPLAAISSKRWPLRTAKYLDRTFTVGMSPKEQAEAILASRRADPAVQDLRVNGIAERKLAGAAGFCADFGFRLGSMDYGDSTLGLHRWPAYSAQGRHPAYRSLYCGFMEGGWFYGASFTASAKHYFDLDRQTFEAALETLRLLGAEP